MKTSEKLKIRLEEYFNKKVVDIERLYPGPYQRSAGAWKWNARFENGNEAGSCFTMTECVKANAWSHLTPYGSAEIFPED